MNPDGILNFAGAVASGIAIYRPRIVGMAGVLPSDVGIASYQMADLDTLRSVDALADYDKQLRARAVELDTEFAGIPMPDEAREEFEAIGDSLVRIEERKTELTARAEFIRQIQGSPPHTVPGGFSAPNVIKSPDDIFDLTAYRQRVGSLDDLPSAYRDGAMRVLDSAVFPTTTNAKAVEHVAKLLEADKKEGNVARRVIGTGSPTYAAAFEHYVKQGTAGMSARLGAALQTYTDADGGYAIPFQIDPTFILTSDGAVNPLRSKARQVSITTKAWQGVTTAGVTAAYEAETASAADGAPTDVAGPTVTPVRAHVWIPFTAEYAEDYGAQLQAEVGGLIQDSKDVLEANKFVLGTGSGEPDGIVARIVTDTTSLVTTITNDTYARADLNKLENALPPRFRARANIAMNKAIAQLTKAFGTAGEPANSLFDGAAGTLLGYPQFELSAMDGVATDAKKIVLIGDFSKFVIVDRIGMAVEYVPQVFDGSGLPLGQRGLYARWRNSTKILVINAFRLLKVQ